MADIFYIMVKQPGSNAYPIFTSKDASIEVIKFTIQEISHIPTEMQCLVYDNILLEGDYAISEIGIKNHDKIYMIFTEMSSIYFDVDYDTIDEKFMWFLPNLRSIAICPTLFLSEDIFKCSENLQDLNISYCTHFSDKIFEHLGNLRTLNIAGCLQFSDKIFEHLGNLRTLNIAYCAQFSDEIFNKIPSLHTLNMAGCSFISGKNFNKTSSITSLNITGCLGLSCEIFKVLPELSSVNASFCSQPLKDCLGKLKNVKVSK